MYLVKTKVEDCAFYSPPVPDDYRQDEVNYRIFSDKDAVSEYIYKNKKNNRYTDNDYTYEIYKVVDGESFMIKSDDHSISFNKRSFTLIEPDCGLILIHEEEL